MEEGWLDPWKGLEGACSSHHGVRRKGRCHSGGEAICGEGARSSDANEEGRRSILFVEELCIWAGGSSQLAVADVGQTPAKKQYRNDIVALLL